MPLAPSWSVLGSQEIKHSSSQCEIKSNELYNRDLTCTSLQHRSSPLITTYPEGIYTLKIINPPRFQKRNSHPSLKKAAEIYPCFNILLFWKHISVAKAKPLILCSSFCTCFQNILIWRREGWTNMTGITTLPEHSANVDQTMTKQSMRAFSHIFLYSFVLMQVSKHWRAVCDCLESPNCKPLIRRMFQAATWYICQCYQCLRLQTWQHCYSTETHWHCCYNGTHTSACAWEHMHGMTRVIPTTRGKAGRVLCV